MKTDNFALTTVKSLALVVGKHLLLWPIWWYSSGLLVVLKATGRQIVSTWRGLALDVWIKNIFRPMYGQYDVASRIISFFMRVIQIIFRFIIMVIISAFIILVPVIYIGLPLLAVYQLIIIYI